MTHTEIHNELLLLSTEFNNEAIDLQDSEIIERTALKTIGDHIISQELHNGIVLEIELPSNISKLSSDQLRYLIDTVSLHNSDVFELNWTFDSNFWPDTFETKEEFKESIQNMLQNKDTFYDLEDDF
jgi:hypothetical protein